MSLHQDGNRLLIKWTPNQLMNVSDSKTKNSTVHNGIRQSNGNHVVDEKLNDEDEK